jgi:glucosylceramidase
MQTESECGDGSNDWKAAMHTWNLMKSYFTSGVNSYMYWNMILDDSGNSTWGWKQNAMISVFTKTKDIQFNVEFYLMKHFSYFIQKGAHRVQLSKINDNILAFENPDGQIVLVICNNTDKDRVMKIKIGDQMITPKISSQSFNTIALNL